MLKEDIKGSANNPALEKSFSFALRIIKVSEYLIDTKKNYVLSKQILRSGTSIGANLVESQGAQTPPDFQTKISVAYKEALETSYWLRLLYAANYITEKQFQSLHDDCSELIRILGATQLTMRQKLDSK